MDSTELYLDLMKKTLTNVIYRDPPLGPKWTVGTEYDHGARTEGKDWPSLAHTMVGLQRLDNLQECIQSVIAERVPGDFIETGVWRGGACIFMRAALRAHDENDRVVWVADSFQGMPHADEHWHKGDQKMAMHSLNDVLAVPASDVRNNFRLYDLLDEKVHFLPGWFADTLPNAPIEKLAILRMDGDLYESTMTTLTSLYPKLSVGGYVIVDDYRLPICQAAVKDYRERHAIDDEIVRIDDHSVFWRRSG